MNQPQRARSLNLCSSTFWLIMVLALMVCALGWRWLVLSGSDTGPVGEWMHELKSVYLPAVLPASSAGDGLSIGADGDFAARIWKLSWLKLNGHWDARVLSSFSLVIHALAWGVVLATILRPLKKTWQIAMILAVGGAALMTPAAGEFFVSEATAWSGWLLLFSILHLHGHLAARPNSWMWWVGCAAGLLNVLGSAEGGATVLVLTASAVSRLLVRGESRRGQWQAFLINGFLVLLSVVLMSVRGSAADPTRETDLWARLAGMYCWPQGYPWALIILSVPSVFWLGKTWRGRSGEDKRSVLCGLAGWSLVQPLLIALVGAHSEAAIWGIVTTVAVVNSACLIALLAREKILTRTTAILFTLWSLAAIHLLIQVEPDLDKAYELTKRNERWLAAWRKDDVAGLADALQVNQQESHALFQQKSAQQFQRILPTSLVAPLAAAPEQKNDRAAFRVTGVPVLRGEATDMLAWGTWSRDGARGAGKFVSTQVDAPEPMIRIWIAGEWQPSSMTVCLRTDDGTDIRPLNFPNPESDRWVRVNFENPRKPFRVVAELKDPGGWAAISGPVPVGRLSWAVPKLIELWPWLLGMGACLGLGYVYLAMRSATRGPPESPSTHEGASVKMLPWLAFFAYACVMAQNVDTAAGGSDSSGYLNNARMFSEGKLTIPPRPVAGVSTQEFGMDILSPMPFKNAAQAGEIAPITATGLPLMCAAVAYFMPLHLAVGLVILANLLLGVLFTRLLAEAFGLSWKWSWIAGFAIGLSPLYLFIGLQGLSDGPSLTWVTAAVYFAWRSREKAGYAWLAGGATALAVLMRSPNALCVVPILICLAGSWRRCLFWVLGGAPGAIFQLWHSWRVWGSPFASGYEKLGDVISLANLPANLAHYAIWLPWLLTPVVLLAFALPFISKPAGIIRWVLGAWIGVFLGFYAVFFFTHTAWWFLRFTLPAFPALIIAALLGARHFGPRIKLLSLIGGVQRSRELLAIGLIGLLLFAVHERQVFFWLGRDKNLIKAGTWLKQHAAPGSTVLSVQGAGTVFYYTDLPVVLYYHDVVRESPAFAKALASGGQDVYALMFHFERPGARPDFLGDWKEMAAFQEGGLKIWKWLGASEGLRIQGNAEGDTPAP